MKNKKIDEDLVHVDFLDNIAEYNLDNEKVLNDVKLLYEVLS